VASSSGAMDRFRQQLRLLSHHQGHRLFRIIILPTNSILKEAARCASNAEKKATGQGTARPNLQTLVQKAGVLSLQLAPTLVLSAVRMGTGQGTALAKFTILQVTPLEGWQNLMSVPINSNQDQNFATVVERVANSYASPFK
jgi:hypothetical protein